MKRLVIYGAGHGFILKTLSAINDINNTWDVVGFIDDDSKKHGTKLFDIPVLGGRSIISELNSAQDCYFFNNVMSEWLLRKQISDVLCESGCQIATLVGPRIDAGKLKVGMGVFIGAFCHFGQNTTIGDFSCILQAAATGDDAVIKSNVFIGCTSYIGSGSEIKDHTYICPNATVLIGKTVGERSIVGAGAVVTKDLPNDVRAYGNPARVRE